MLVSQTYFHCIVYNWLDFTVKFPGVLRIDHDWFYAYKILVSVNIPLYIPRVGLATMVTHFDLPIVFYYFSMKKL